MVVRDAVRTTLPKISQIIFSLRAPTAPLKIRRFHRHLILALLFTICALFYYFGELVDLAGWEALHWQFFYGPHDIHRMFFFIPIMYTSYFFSGRAIAGIFIATTLAFLPRAIFISPFPDAIFRTTLFVIGAAVLSSFVRLTIYKHQKATAIETVVKQDQKRSVGVQNIIGDRVIITGELEIDLSKRLVKRCGETVKLTRTEYKLLEYLVLNSKKVMTQKEILNAIWGPGYSQEREYVRNYVHQLRCKIENDPSNPQIIITESGFGYRFIEV